MTVSSQYGQCAYSLDFQFPLWSFSLVPALEEQAMISPPPPDFEPALQENGNWLEIWCLKDFWQQEAYSKKQQQQKDKDYKKPWVIFMFLQKHETSNEKSTGPSVSKGKETGIKNSNTTVIGAHCQSCTSLRSHNLCKQASEGNCIIRWREIELGVLLGHGPLRYQPVFFLGIRENRTFLKWAHISFLFKLYIIWNVPASKHQASLCSQLEVAKPVSEWIQPLSSWPMKKREMRL